MPRRRKSEPQPPSSAELRRQHWDEIKTMRWPRPWHERRFLRQGNVPKPPKRAPSARQKQVMRDSTRAKRARRDREAMT